MDTESQRDTKIDIRSHDEVKPGIGSLSQHAAHELVTEHPQDGYSYPPGYQSVPMASAHTQLSNSPLPIPNAETGEDPPGYWNVPMASAHNQQSNRHLPIPNAGTRDPSMVTTHVIVTQPGQTPCYVINQKRPTDFLCPSVLACLCCFWPTGIVAIFFACMATKLADKGQMKDAKIMSNFSMLFTILSVVIGIAFGIVVYIMYTQ